MTEPHVTNDEAVTSRRLLRALDAAAEKLEAVKRSKFEPIAVIGLSCRFPKAANPEEFWQLIRGRVDAITEIPPQRWDVDAYYDPDPAAPGKMYARHGGFLAEIDGFDARFFETSPREAVGMDPQQRLALEVSWEALEDAGLAAAQLAGSQTGVFLGVTTNDYSGLLAGAGGLEGIDAYFSSGNALNAVAGRVAHFLGLQGPVLAVDTACSSSLVAVHLACQNLRGGDCDVALAGGVNLILSPEVQVALCKAKMLSADGRCRTFDNGASGYVRGEGCGVVVLKRMSDAERDGDRVLALIRGSAVNHDGPSSGFTVPSGPAQEALIRRALSLAHVEAHHIDYLEAHGTGTSLGDPIEVRTAVAALGAQRPSGQPLVIGSVKTNIGHLESAAGVAGLIKVILALRHRQLPSQLHFKTPNAHIDWDDLPVVVATQCSFWPARSRPRLAGINSFGASGTNAHLVVSEAPAVPPPAAADVERPLHALALSAKSESALRELARRYDQRLAGQPAPELSNVCYSANAGRSHFTARLFVAAESCEHARQKLRGFVAGEISPGVAYDRSRADAPPKVAFLFSGQGAQYAGMGHQLYETQPTFRRAIDRCAQILRNDLDRPLTEVLFAPEPSCLRETAYTQPALFALEFALSELWKSWGVEPAAVLGHSVGEYVAACVAGVFSVEDGLRLIAQRARLMQRLPGDGAMAAVFAGEPCVREAMGRHADEVSVAAVNAPDQTVISGLTTAVNGVLETLRAQGVEGKFLEVSHAFHSNMMEPMLDDFGRVARQIDYCPPGRTFISNVTGQAATDEVTTPEYWIDHVRRTVRFADGMRALGQSNCDVFVEIGPAATLLAIGRQCLADVNAQWCASLRRGGDDWPQLLDTLGTLYVKGMPIDWRGFDRDYPRQRVGLPTYPWQRKSYWPVASRNEPDQPDDGDLLYRLQWQPLPRLAAATNVGDDYSKPAGDQSPPGEGQWLIFADRNGLGRRLCELLERRGYACTMAYRGDRFEQTGEAAFELSGERATDLDRLLASLEMDRLQGVVHLWSLDAAAGGAISDTSLTDACKSGCGSALQTVKSLVDAQPCALRGLWFVTRGAVAVDATESIPGLAQSTLWGLARVVALEHAELRPRCIDLDPASPHSESAEALCGEIFSADGENQVALRDNGRNVARLKRSELTDPTSPLSFRDDAAYLITGGLGSLGMLVARWMATRGAKHLFLVGRSGVDASRATQIEGIRRCGARVTVCRADVADADQLAGVLAQIDATAHPLRGVIHAAGILDDGALHQLNWERLIRVLRPKVLGAWNLHWLTKGRNLDCFVLFSSVTSLIGTAGQANYAAANAFLDALAADRRATGLPALSINWGPWSDVGIASRRPVAERITAAGGALLSPATGIRMLERVWRCGASQIAVAPVHWNELPVQLAAQPVFAELRPASPAPASATAVEDADLRHLQQLPPRQRRVRLIRAVRGEVARVLRLDVPEEIDLHQGFFELGMDSLTSVELRNRLQIKLGRALPATAAFDYPSTEKLVGFLLAQMDEADTKKDEADQWQHAPAGDRREVAQAHSEQDELDEMSEEEIARLIDAELEASSRRY